MTIGLDNKEELRVLHGSHDGIGDAFINVNAIQNGDDEHYTEGLSVSAFEMHQIFLIRKERTYKLFSFRKEDTVHLSDFGFYADGEVLFSNSVIVDAENKN